MARMGALSSRDAECEGLQLPVGELQLGGALFKTLTACQSMHLLDPEAPRPDRSPRQEMRWWKGKSN